MFKQSLFEFFPYHLVLHPSLFFTHIPAHPPTWIPLPRSLCCDDPASVSIPKFPAMSMTIGLSVSLAYVLVNQCDSCFGSIPLQPIYSVNSPVILCRSAHKKLQLYACPLLLRTTALHDLSSFPARSTVRCQFHPKSRCLHASLMHFEYPKSVSHSKPAFAFKSSPPAPPPTRAPPSPSIRH